MNASELHIGDWVVTGPPWADSKIWEVVRIASGATFAMAEVMPVFEFTLAPKRIDVKDEFRHLWIRSFNVAELRPAMEIANDVIKVWQLVLVRGQGCHV